MMLQALPAEIRQEKRRGEKKEKDGQDTMPEKEESKPSLSADGTSDNMYEIPQRMSVNVLGLMSQFNKVPSTGLHNNPNYNLYLSATNTDALKLKI